ncbi:hypothetical protein TNCV_2831051 [Trichonephila clavipes]|nr:hypothetical protein TNCV_2831051 [Trichonephila clavipes]
MNSFYLTRAVQGSGGSLMIWGMLYGHVNCFLVLLEGKQTSTRYLDTLADQVHLAMLYFYPDAYGYFMYDNVAIHPARSVQS